MTVELEPVNQNVFADLGLSRPEERMRKAQYARQIMKLLEAKALPLAEAAAYLSLTEGDLNDILYGRLTQRSMEQLSSLVDRLAEYQSKPPQSLLRRLQGILFHPSRIYRRRHTS